jgi:hypothetical protein
MDDPSKARALGTEMLVDLIGIDYFGNAVYVIGETRQIGNSILVPAGRLGRLERLELSNTDADIFRIDPSAAAR